MLFYTFSEGDEAISTLCLFVEYVETAFIPSGARYIRIEEVRSAENYLALKSSSGYYYLNGHWTIQDTGKYDAAGTKVFYARRNQKDQLRAIGPTKEDLHVQVCQQIFFIFDLDF